MFRRLLLALVLLVPATGVSLLAFPVPPRENVRALHASEVWDRTTGKGVVVAVVDGGIDETHDALKGRVAEAKDFTGSLFGAVPAASDHGTHCSGIVLQIAPDAKLVSAKVISDQRRGLGSGIAAGVRWAADRSDVISMSIATHAREEIVVDALNYAWDKGCVLVAGADNRGPDEDTIGWPAGMDGVIAVGAVEKTADRWTPADFSSRGLNVFTAAPGVNIVSTIRGNSRGAKSGTSMATPHVSGLAALWIQANPQVKRADRPRAFIAALKASCTDIHTPGRDTATGWGLPDARKLVVAR